MRRLLSLTVVVIFAPACAELPTQVTPTEALPTFSVVGADNAVGAIVLNRGEATSPIFGTCNYEGVITNDVTIVGMANGGAIFKCHWADYPAPDYGQALVVRDWTCSLLFPDADFFGVTNRTSFVLSQNHNATVTCIFQDAPSAGNPGPMAPPNAACQGAIVSGIASTWPWAHDGRMDFMPPPGAIALWLREFGPALGISKVRELQQLFC